MLLRQLLLLLVAAASVRGHGRLIDPPSRSSAWRFGFNTPTDYDDNQGYCGGRERQHGQNGGLCGVCGDAWDTYPRDHEMGGKFATGTIVRTYIQGQQIQIGITITTNHLGYFEYRICPVGPHQEASQDCLNRHPLYSIGWPSTRIPIGTAHGDMHQVIQLPPDLYCRHCVLQWRYVTGNSWGYCNNTGRGDKGCGPQEEFRACSDVTIRRIHAGLSVPVIAGHATGVALSHYGPANATFIQTPIYHPKYPSYSPSVPVAPDIVPSRHTILIPPHRPQRCITTVTLEMLKQPMDKWCHDNCNHIPRHCPASLCVCFEYI